MHRAPRRGSTSDPFNHSPQAPNGIGLTIPKVLQKGHAKKQQHIGNARIRVIRKFVKQQSHNGEEHREGNTGRGKPERDHQIDAAGQNEPRRQHVANQLNDWTRQFE